MNVQHACVANLVAWCALVWEPLLLDPISLNSCKYLYGEIFVVLSWTSKNFIHIVVYGDD